MPEGHAISEVHIISIVGLGYIGLPTAAIFASRKLRVIGVDITPEVVETINRGDVHIVEPELDILVRAVVSEGYLRAQVEPEPADAFVIAVPTPVRNQGNERVPDLSCIRAACQSIAPVLRKGNLVILESTSPVGATERMAEWLAEARPDLSFPQTHGAASDIRIAHCPERVLPGNVVRELVENDRVVGGMTPRCADAAVELYGNFVQGKCFTTGVRTAEMVKLTENSFRDVNIAFANELSMVCDTLGIDVWELIELANHHPRVNILQPGAGVGGHCIAVDPWFIVSQAPDEARLIRTAREVNDAKPEWVVQKVSEAVGRFLQAHPARTARDVTVACFGLSFKPDIDDLRESPALAIAQELEQQHPGKLLLVEPHIEALPAGQFKRSVLVKPDLAARRADVIVLLVDHSAFRDLDGSRIDARFLVDTRGLWIRGLAMHAPGEKGEESMWRECSA